MKYMRIRERSQGAKQLLGQGGKGKATGITFIVGVGLTNVLCLVDWLQ